MTDQDSIEQGKQILKELTIILRNLSDTQVPELLGTGLLDDLLKALLDSSETSNYPNLDEFLLAKKNRSTIIAGIRNAITQNYALKGISGDKTGFISPSHIQWFDDGVMFLQGNKPFEGFLGLYRQDKSLSYAIAEALILAI